MASLPINPLLFLTILSLVLPLGSLATLPTFKAPAPLVHHHGPVLGGQLNIAIMWYGRFARETKNILRDFLLSLNKPTAGLDPSVASWWKTVERYQHVASQGHPSGPITVKIVKQKTDRNYSLGKILTQDFFQPLMDKVTGGNKAWITIIFAARDVSVAETCMGRCSRHGAIGSGRNARLYMVIGNPETECPGVCGWPFHKADYGPQTLPLQPPNGNIGADAMVIGLASALAGTVTNPFNTGFYAGEAMKPIEAANACPGIFGSGAFPGFAGKVLIAPGNGGCFNAHGINGRKYLLPALWNPDTKSCWTLI